MHTKLWKLINIYYAVAKMLKDLIIKSSQEPLLHPFLFHNFIKPLQHGKNDKSSNQQQYKIYPKEIGFVFVAIPHGGQYPRQFIANGSR